MGTGTDMLRSPCNQWLQGQLQVTIQTKKAKWDQDIMTWEERRRVVVQSGTREGGIYLQSAWIRSVSISVSWHADTGPFAVFVWQPVVVEDSESVDQWRWKGNISGGTWRRIWATAIHILTKKFPQGQQPSWSEWKRIASEENQWMRESIFWRIRLFKMRR